MGAGTGGHVRPAPPLPLCELTRVSGGTFSVPAVTTRPGGLLGHAGAHRGTATRATNILVVAVRLRCRTFAGQTLWIGIRMVWTFLHTSSQGCVTHSSSLTHTGGSVTVTDLIRDCSGIYWTHANISALCRVVLLDAHLSLGADLAVLALDAGAAQHGVSVGQVRAGGRGGQTFPRLADLRGLAQLGLVTNTLLVLLLRKFWANMQTCVFEAYRLVPAYFIGGISTPTLSRWGGLQFFGAFSSKLTNRSLGFVVILGRITNVYIFIQIITLDDRTTLILFFSQ